MHLTKLSSIILFSLFVGLEALAQYSAPENWFNLDPQVNKINGVSSDRMHEEILKDVPAKKIIVAVIDSGVDPEHEDLKDVMWVNKDEIPGNGIDDDNNGYIDDIHGWNFIGGKDGEHVYHDTYELTRIVKKLSEEFKDVDPSKLKGADLQRYNKYLSYKEDIENEVEKASTQVEQYSQIINYVNMALEMTEDALGEEPVTKENIDALDSDQYGMVKSFFAQLFPQLGPFEGSVDELRELVLADMEEALDHFSVKMNYSYNIGYDSRTIVNDDFEDVNERYYGNPDVKGPHAFHGTHVAGIIAAKRDNEVGMKGVAEHVSIMSVRAVPDGDERDKDVANAIRYAVDNGASIINMSFGKGFSPREKAVEKAIKYAERKDVLLVHAAGNSSQNNDEEPNFPNATYDQYKPWFSKKKAQNWIEVGALSWRKGEDMVASFSNYGKNNVDLFAPGQDIYSTAPDGAYKNASGTSMASPVVAGVAAILRAHFPKLSAKEIKEILVESSVTVDLQVKKPGSSELVPFKDLSSSGGVVNVRSALRKAFEITNKGKSKGSETRPAQGSDKGRA